CWHELRPDHHVCHVHRPLLQPHRRERHTRHTGPVLRVFCLRHGGHHRQLMHCGNSLVQRRRHQHFQQCRRCRDRHHDVDTVQHSGRGTSKRSHGHHGAFLDYRRRRSSPLCGCCHV